MKQAFRHGDVVIITSAVIPKLAKPLTHLVLAEGEVTGHAHRITEGKATLYQYDGKLYLRVESETALLQHEEHKPIALPKGDHAIQIQREYEPSGWRNVAD